MQPVSSKLRKEIEALIYQVFDTLDNTKMNSEHYKTMFAQMDDKKFTEFISLRFPYKFHVKPFVVEPKMQDCSNALKLVDSKLFEQVNLPYLYKNKEGKPVKSKEALVVYIPHKKVQQFITKKNSMSVDITNRDMKTGLLSGADKNGKATDREMESFAVLGLDKSMDEFATYRGDSMKAKNLLYNTINTLGQASQEDIPVDTDDSLSRNLLNSYLMGAMINTNLINQDYILSYTLKDKKKEIARK